MPYCFNCGKPVIETDNCCPSCGVELGKAAPLEGDRRFPTPLPDYTRTRLLTSDNADQKRDYGKTRLIDYDKEESGPTTALGKTRLIGAEDITELKTTDKPPSKPLPQQVESYKTRLITDSEHPGTTKTTGKQVSVTTINPLEFETARVNARKYKKARNTWLVLAIIFICATGAFLPLYVVTYEEARDYQWMYNDTKNELYTTKNELYTIREDYEKQLEVKQEEYNESSYIQERTGKIGLAGPVQITGEGAADPRHSQTEIRAAVSSALGQARQKYNELLKTNPDASGSISIIFDIQPDGSVENATFSNSTLPDANLIGPILSGIRGLSFSAIEGGSVRVTYPLSLTPQ